MEFRRVAPPVFVALAAALLLTACPGPAPNPSTTPTGSTTGTPTPTRSATPGPAPLGAEVAFVISGTFASPNGGTTLDVTMTVEAPTQADAAADAAAFAGSAHCPPDILAETGPAITDPAYLHLTVESAVSGAPYAGEAGVSLGFPGFVTTWSGDYLTAQAYCSPPYLSPVPGTATAIGMLQNGVATGPGGWIPSTGGYGVGVYVSGTATTYTVRSCTIDFGPASAGTPAAGFVRVDTATGCSFGLADTP